MKNSIFRGILIGGSLGVLLFLAELAGNSLSHAFLAGAFAGGLAGLTMAVRRGQDTASRD